MKCSLTQNGEEMVTGYWYHYGNDFGEATLFSGASVSLYTMWGNGSYLLHSMLIN